MNMVKHDGPTVLQYPYSVAHLRRDNPDTAFPDVLNDETCRQFGVAYVEEGDVPPYNPQIEALKEARPALEEGRWCQRWLVETLDPTIAAAVAASSVPQSVTMRQARLALLGAGLLDSVDIALAAIPDEMQRRAAQIEWEFAASVDRQSPWVANLSAALGLTDAQLDALFVVAAGL